MIHKHSEHKHSEHHEHHHKHSHGIIDPSIISTEKGIKAVKLSFFVMMITAALQIIVVIFTGSVALLADTIHNFGDAATAIPLWIAFKLGMKKTSKKFTYGYGRVEDLAGVIIVLIILFSAVVAGYESIHRIIYPQKVQNLWAIVVASIIGFLGNEGVAIFRIKVGKEIGSVALIADGYHARVDGYTSLAVLLGAIGIWLGFPLADPIIGILITFAILKIVYDSTKAVFIRLLDGVDPEVLEEIHHTLRHISEIKDIAEIRARWIGHRLHAEINIALNPNITIEEGHTIAMKVRHELFHNINYLSNAVIHIDPLDKSGEEKHHISEHKHDDFPAHSH